MYNFIPLYVLEPSEENTILVLKPLLLYCQKLYFILKQYASVVFSIPEGALLWLM